MSLAYYTAREFLSLRRPGLITFIRIQVLRRKFLFRLWKRGWISDNIAWWIELDVWEIE